MKRKMTLFVLFFLLTPIVALAKWPKGADPFARAAITPKSGSRVQGTADFAKVKDRLMVRVYLDDTPAGPHGIHIHEKGDCSAPDASSAGDHYNPTGKSHGGPQATKSHVGDLGNITASRRGNAFLEVTLAGPSPKFDWNQIIGKSIVVHEKQDDLKTQPSGGSGKRIACGTIAALPGLSE